MKPMLKQFAKPPAGEGRSVMRRSKRRSTPNNPANPLPPCGSGSGSRSDGDLALVAGRLVRSIDPQEGLHRRRGKQRSIGGWRSGQARLRRGDSG